MTRYFALVPLLAATLAVPAHAQELSVSVGYADLDLTSDGGVQRLDHRIKDAVEQVCGDRSAQQPLSAVLAIRKCSRDTWTDIEAPRQVAIERARGRVPSVEVADARGASGFAITVRRR